MDGKYQTEFSDIFAGVFAITLALLSMGLATYCVQKEKYVDCVEALRHSHEDVIARICKE